VKRLTVKDFLDSLPNRVELPVVKTESSLREVLRTMIKRHRGRIVYVADSEGTGAFLLPAISFLTGFQGSEYSLLETYLSMALVIGALSIAKSLTIIGQHGCGFCHCQSGIATSGFFLVAEQIQEPLFGLFFAWPERILI